MEKSRLWCLHAETYVESRSAILSGGARIRETGTGLALSSSERCVVSSTGRSGIS